MGEEEEEEEEEVLTPKNERTDCGDETSKERVEGKGANQTAVAELDYASKKNIEQVCINNFQFLWRRVHVFIIEPENNGSQILRHLDSKYFDLPLTWQTHTTSRMYKIHQTRSEDFM